MQVMKGVGVLSLAVFIGSVQVASAKAVPVDQPTHPMVLNHDWEGDPSSTLPNDNGIQYHGGPLLGNNPDLSNTPTIYFIWYGGWDPVSDPATPILENFANFIGGSPYFNINTSYCNATDCTVGGNPVINAVNFGGSAFDAYSLGSSISDSGIRTIVDNALRNGLVPFDPNGVYFVLTSVDVNETSGMCTRFCGWHTFYNSIFGNVKYSFVGSPLNCSSTQCTPQRFNSPNDPNADGIVNIVAHELEESVTDPNLNAWFDTRGQENADKCAWTFGQTYQVPNGSFANMNLGGLDYLIQRNWVNAFGGYCDLSY